MIDRKTPEDCARNPVAGDVWRRTWAGIPEIRTVVIVRRDGIFWKPPEVKGFSSPSQWGTWCAGATLVKRGDE